MSKPIYEIPLNGEPELPGRRANRAAQPQSYDQAPPPAGSWQPYPTPDATPQGAPTGSAAWPPPQAAHAWPSAETAAPSSHAAPPPSHSAPAPGHSAPAYAAPRDADWVPPGAEGLIQWPEPEVAAAASWPTPAPEPEMPASQWPAPQAAAGPAAAPSASWPAPAPDAVEAPGAAAATPAAFAPPPVAPMSAAQQAFASESGRNSGLNPDPDLTFNLEEVLRLRASDLHVSVNSVPMVRVDGALIPATNAVIWDHDKVESALRSILTPAQAEIFDEVHELDFAYTVSANARFRVNFYQQRDNMGGAFRLIPTEIKPLKDLGVPDSVAQFASLPRGLVLVTGPTGSGKSTTLAALLDLVNRTRADHIMTVEDPIEFLHGNHRSVVNQREVGRDTHSFGAALKHVLRQDPDVILIGELRDLETISVALTAAETGHLVFATLHTQDAPQTIDRIIDVFPPHQQGQVRAQLAATLQGVVCQTLVKRASGKGRAVATEVLVTTPAVGNLIREGKTFQIPTAMQAGRDLGMNTMDQHLAELVNAGVVTRAAALEKAHDIDSFERLLHVEDPTAGRGSNNANYGAEFGDSFASTNVRSH